MNGSPGAVRRQAVGPVRQPPRGIEADAQRDMRKTGTAAAVNDSAGVPERSPATGNLPPRARWDACLPVSATPMQHRIWNEAGLAAENRGRTSQLLETDGAIALMLQQSRRGPLCLATAEELGEPCEPACSGQVAAENLAALMLAQKRPIRLGQPPADTAFSDAMVRQARKAGILFTFATEGSPFIELDDSWTSAPDRFNARRRADFRRMRRRAESAGALRFEFHSPTTDNVTDLLDRAIDIEARGWKGHANTAIADNPFQSAFYRRYAKLAAGEGILRIAFLKIGSDIAAVQIAVECDNRFWLLKIGYDEQFARCSPGQILMLESIERAARNGLTHFEFLGKAAPWTRLWTTGERPRMKLFYYPRNIAGVTALTSDASRIAISRLATMLRGKDRDEGTEAA
ncbi:GNAT family N-acetyltransferase [Novosphingobium sp. ZN18A2]|uniref:GNAT family N-acetyltransferase n=1 Tax=Novosphingobium sp. ZN18A2 TaxID=3079861 RepID=UPI0030CE8EF8